MNDIKVQAYQVARALAKRHSDDLFFTEVKNGSTWFTSTGDGLRLDAMAIKKSWVHPCITGYEIKVSRSDWLRDTKFVRYMAYCNELWVVAPAGIISPGEIPVGIGLKTYAPASGNIKTVVKAAYRDIEPPVDMLLYLLMQYAQSDRRPDPKIDRREMIHQYLADKLDDYNLARAFKGKLIEKAGMVVSLENNNKHLKGRNDDQTREITDGKAELEKYLGHNIWNIRHGVQELSRSIGKNVSWNTVMNIVDNAAGAMIRNIKSELEASIQDKEDDHERPDIPDTRL